MMPESGDHVLHRSAGADITTVDDGMHRVPVDQPLHRLNIGGVTHLAGVFEIGLQRPPENAAQGVDLLAGERQAVPEFDSVGGGEIGERRGLAHRDRCTGGARAVVEAGQHGGCPGQRRSPEKATPAGDDVGSAECRLAHGSLLRKRRHEILASSRSAWAIASAWCG